MCYTLSIKQSILHEIPIFRDFEPQKTHHQSSFFSKMATFPPRTSGVFSSDMACVFTPQAFGSKPTALGMKGDEFSWHLYQTCNVGDRYFLGGLIIVMIFFLLFGNHLFKKKAAVRPWPLSAQKVIIWCFCAARTGDNKQPNKGVVV